MEEKEKTKKKGLEIYTLKEMGYATVLYYKDL